MYQNGEFCNLLEGRIGFCTLKTAFHPKGWIFYFLKDAIYPEGWNRREQIQFFLTVDYENAFHSDILNNAISTSSILIYTQFSVKSSETKFVKLSDLTKFFPRHSIEKFIPWEEFSNAWTSIWRKNYSIDFFPRDSIGKFFPWGEFFNAWTSIWRKNPSIDFFPRDSIGKFFPWEEFLNA